MGSYYMMCEWSGDINTLIRIKSCRISEPQAITMLFLMNSPRREIPGSCSPTSRAVSSLSTPPSSPTPPSPSPLSEVRLSWCKIWNHVLLLFPGLAYLFYFLTTQNSSGGGYGSSSGYGYGEDEYGYSRRFRRDTKDTEWIRILTLLDVGTEMYDNMSQENMDNKCPAKIICQAFESREIFGGNQSYLSLFYQFVNSMKFNNSEINDNYLTEETSSCRTRYPECHISLLSSFQSAFEERRDAKLKFVKK